VHLPVTSVLLGQAEVDRALKDEVDVGSAFLLGLDVQVICLSKVLQLWCWIELRQQPLKE